MAVLFTISLWKSLLFFILCSLFLNATNITLLLIYNNLKKYEQIEDKDVRRSPVGEEKKSKFGNLDFQPGFCQYFRSFEIIANR